MWYNENMEKKIICPKCGKEEIWKSGKSGGKQQYQCKNCKITDCTEENDVSSSGEHFCFGDKSHSLQ